MLPECSLINTYLWFSLHLHDILFLHKWTFPPQLPKAPRIYTLQVQCPRKDSLHSPSDFKSKYFKEEAFDPAWLRCPHPQVPINSGWDRGVVGSPENMATSTETFRKKESCVSERNEGWTKELVFTINLNGQESVERRNSSFADGHNSFLVDLE